MHWAILVASVACLPLGRAGSVAVTPARHLVIGILTQPSPLGDGSDVLAASYVKWVEAAGGMVVPVPYTNTTREQIVSLAAALNGVVIPGGIEIHMRGKDNPGRWIYEAALSMNAAGEHFPIWGTCGGFETLLMFASGDDDILEEGFDAHNLPLALEWTANASTSRLVQKLPSEVVASLANPQLPIAANQHDKGIGLQRWSLTHALQDFFEVLSINEDRSGRAFVSTIEAKRVPFFGTQWHPEKPMFEKYPPVAENSNFSYGPEAVLAGQAIANFFMSEARRNSHAFPLASLPTSLIFNWSPRHSDLVPFEQVYFFDWREGAARHPILV